MVRWSVPAIILVAALLIPVWTASAQQASLSIPPVSVAPGQSTAGQVQFSANGAGVASLQFDLAFDTSALTITATAGSATTAAGKSLSENTLANGNQRYLIAGLNQDVIGDGSVADLTIHANPGASGVYQVNIVNTLASSPNSIAIPLSVQSGQVTIITPPITSTPTDTPTSTPTNTNTPTNTSTITPTNTPTNTPQTVIPTTNTSTRTPTDTPTRTPTDTPTRIATNTPTSTPTNTLPGVTPPTSTLTSTPTNTPTGGQTLQPGIGGRGFAVSPGTDGVVLTWRGGTDQTGYQIVKMKDGATTLLPVTLGASATQAIDLDVQGARCYVLVTQGTTPARTSDFECAVLGLQAGAAPQGFTIRLDQSDTAKLTWRAPVPGTPDGYTLVDVGGGLTHLPGTATSVNVPLTGFGCFLLQAVKDGTIEGSTNAVCAAPGYSNLGP